MTDAHRSFSFLVNPLSGGGSGPKVVVPLARQLREVGAHVEVTYTAHADEVPELVARAVAREAVVVSVGGDGMLSSIAGRVAAAGGILGLVPAGRGNDFARAVGAPTETKAIARQLLDGTPRATDLLRVTSGATERIVAGSVYAGVDARAASIVDRSRWLPSKLQYPVAAVIALGSYRPSDVRLEVDGVVTEHRAATVVIANSAYYGKGMKIAPPATVDDGQLDVVVIESAGRFDLIRSLPKVYDGSHTALDQVHVVSGRSVRLSGALRGGGAVPVGADGETLPDLPAAATRALTVELMPAAIRVLR